jgi:sulfonate transport system substrate-binding protein
MSRWKQGFWLGAISQGWQLLQQQFFVSNTLKAFSLLFATGLSLSLLVASCSPSSTTTSAASPGVASGNQAKVIRVGYQKSATVLNVLKNQRSLEKRLQPEGVNVEWNEFAAGPQMLEALNVGSIDFAYTGETPPVTAQAAGTPLVYIASEAANPGSEAILVLNDSPIKSVADLKGKKVALNKGSNVHYLLVRALEAAGLQYTDIETAFLPPGDARPAFEQGKVDAWVIWDPFYAAAEKNGARVLVDGKDLVPNRGFFFSSQAFASQNPELIKTFINEADKASAWAKGNRSGVADILSKSMGIDKAVLEVAEKRKDYGLSPLSTEVIADQQKIADSFYKLKLIPKETKVAEVVWKG